MFRNNNPLFRGGSLSIIVIEKACLFYGILLNLYWLLLLPPAPAYYHFIMNQCSIQYIEVTNLSGNHMQSCYARTQDG